MIIVKKLQSAKQLVDLDKEVAAGLYTYAIDEFGRLLLSKESKLASNQYEINTDWFKGPKARKDKFHKAIDYLEANHHEKCYVINDEGSFTAESFSWKSFNLGLLPDFEARLSIFYLY